MELAPPENRQRRGTRCVTHSRGPLQPVALYQAPDSPRYWNFMQRRWLFAAYRTESGERSIWTCGRVIF